ncbi:MAG: hypothetical protein AAFZ91_06795 [Pseudomonadota bacterium]
MYPLKPNEWGSKPYRRLRSEKPTKTEKIRPTRLLRNLITLPFTFGFTTIWVAYNIAAVSAMNSGPRRR